VFSDRDIHRGYGPAFKLNVGALSAIVLCRLQPDGDIEDLNNVPATAKARVGCVKAGSNGGSEVVIPLILSPL
jgi:hypothetical protein